MVSCFLATCPQSHRRPRDLVRRHWSHLVSEATPVWAVLVDDRPAIVAPADDRLVVVCGGLRAVDWTVEFGHITEVSSARSVVYVVDDDGHCYDFTFLDSGDAVRATELIDRRRAAVRGGGPGAGAAERTTPTGRNGAEPVDLGWAARSDGGLGSAVPGIEWLNQPGGTIQPLLGRPQPQAGDAIDWMVTATAPPTRTDAPGGDGGAVDRIQPETGSPDAGDAPAEDTVEAARPTGAEPVQPAEDHPVAAATDDADHPTADPEPTDERPAEDAAGERAEEPPATPAGNDAGDPATDGAAPGYGPGEGEPAADGAGPAPATVENGRSTVADEVEDTRQDATPDGGDQELGGDQEPGGDQELGADQELGGGAEPADEPHDVESPTGGLVELPIEREVAMAIARSGGEPIDWGSMPTRGSLPVPQPQAPPLPIPAQGSAHASESVLLVTTEAVSGRVVVEVHGDVLAVASWPAPSPAGRSVHEVARDRLAQAVLRRGGNALVGLRYGATGLVGGDVVAYGTAVTLDPVEAAPATDGADPRARESADR